MTSTEQTHAKMMYAGISQGETLSRRDVVTVEGETTRGIDDLALSAEKQRPAELDLSDSDKGLLHRDAPLISVVGVEERRSGSEVKKLGTPERLKVPKAFKFPERYKSPTDAMMSPVSKGLLRNRKGGALLPPSLYHHKIQDIRTGDVGILTSETTSIEC